MQCSNDKFKPEDTLTYKKIFRTNIESFRGTKIAAQKSAATTTTSNSIHFKQTSMLAKINRPAWPNVCPSFFAGSAKIYSFGFSLPLCEFWPKKDGGPALPSPAASLFFDMDEFLLFFLLWKKIWLHYVRRGVTKNGAGMKLNLFYNLSSPMFVKGRRYEFSLKIMY